MQHLEYVPFGEVFIDERNGSFDTAYKFNGKELDEETGLYYYGARYYNPKTGLWLSVDPLAEKTLQPYQYAYNNPIMLIDPTGMEAKGCPTCPVETYIQLSKHVYTANLKVGMKTENNWEVVKVDKPKSGHIGAVYKGIHEGKTEYIYASKGTTMSSLVDWDNNISQAENGFSAQYYQSIELAKKYSDMYQGISFTGHSKGGGQANAQAMAVGGKAVVFNPASVSDKTIKNYELNPKSANITSIVVAGEILNTVQEMVGMNKHGKTIEINPYKRQSSGVERHGMDFVEKSYEAFQGKRPYDNRTYRQ